MAIKKVPSLDGSGKIFDKHIPGRLQDAQLKQQFVRFVDLAGNPISARHVTIKVDTSTWEIADIIAEA
ncbi:hypothetical protein [Arthrobacter sp. B2a2-09]|uniref:hypothetical protein n=1 Tax=Arthrobacter sp. B2a2-09 TaxID=2952822 RepID=UPI0022CD7021|nr:hypothetical protein [Arthrobacter sp. B2a2-09]MCZ9884164.1 hypothetical protein [Arthrobacter sp. B2a2-09]